MAKRIIKEVLKDGSIQYRIETNKIFFNLIKCKWHTATKYVFIENQPFPTEAIFPTLKEAEIFIGNYNPVIQRHIIREIK